MSNDFPVKLWIDACLKIADQAGLEILRVYRQEDFGQNRRMTRVLLQMRTSCQSCYRCYASTF